MAQIHPVRRYFKRDPESAVLSPLAFQSEVETALSEVCAASLQVRHGNWLIQLVGPFWRGHDLHFEQKGAHEFGGFFLPGPPFGWADTPYSTRLLQKSIRSTSVKHSFREHCTKWPTETTGTLLKRGSHLVS